MSPEDLRSVHNDPWYTVALSYDWVFECVGVDRLVDARPYILWSRGSPFHSDPTSYKADESSSEPEADSKPWWLSRYFGQDSNSERPVLLDPCPRARVIQPAARIRPRRGRPTVRVHHPSRPKIFDDDQAFPRVGTDSTSFESMASTLVYPTGNFENDVLGDSSGTSTHPLGPSYSTLHTVWVARENGSKIRKFSPSKSNGSSTSNTST